MKKILKLLGILLIFIILGIIYIVFNNIRISNINKSKKKNYSEIVQTVNDIKLYKKINSDYIEIGNIKKDTVIYLEETNYKNDYYKLADENYYIYYKNIKPSKQDNSINYLPFNIKIITTDKFEMNNIIINESKELSVYLKKDNYFVKFNNQLFELDNKYIKETKEVNNGTYTDSIVVLNLINYTDEQLKIISEYKTLTLEQYKMWKNNEIELDIKSILLITDKEDELFNKYNLITNKSDIEFEYNDMVSTKDSLNSYSIDNINNKTLIKMLNKDKIEHVTIPSTSVPVLNYHFFYNSNGEVCNESICLDTAKFEEQLKYLKDNNFKTLTMEEFIDWYNGDIEVPVKSVLLTIDDGAMGTSFINGNKLIPLLEKYDLHATLFLVTAWWDPKNYMSDNLDIESHGYDIHKIGECGTQNIKCLEYDELYNDLKKSFDIVDSYNSFCYPFYVHTSASNKILKELGVQVAFGGGYGNVTRNSNRYYLPRYIIYSNITMQQFINMVN